MEGTMKRLIIGLAAIGISALGAVTTSPTAAQAAIGGCSKWIETSGSVRKGYASCYGNIPAGKYYRVALRCSLSENTYTVVRTNYRKVGSGSVYGVCPAKSYLPNVNWIYIEFK